MKKEELLTYLTENGAYLSGEELSRKFGVSRSAIWKNINQLREDGYEIESVTNRGYRLVSSPDLLTEAEIRKGLQTKIIGQNVYYYPIVDSTNEAAKRLANEGAENGSVFVAEQQSHGKGRLGRNWVSPPGEGIWFSVLLRTSVIPLQISNITLLAGLAVSKGIENNTGLKARIKWPNDVVIGTKKVCGILTEMAAEIERVNYIVIGIGVNANTPAFPEEISIKATSILLETGKAVRRAALLREILAEFEKLYDKYFIRGEDGMLEEYKPYCISLGRKVSTIRNGKPVTGIAEDITPSGELLVQCEDGSSLAVNSGEVTVQGIYGQ